MPGLDQPAAREGPSTLAELARSIPTDPSAARAVVAFLPSVPDTTAAWDLAILDSAGKERARATIDAPSDVNLGLEAIGVHLRAYGLEVCGGWIATVDGSRPCRITSLR